MDEITITAIFGIIVVIGILYLCYRAVKTDCIPTVSKYQQRHYHLLKLNSTKVAKQWHHR